MGGMRASIIQMLCIVIGKNRAGLSQYWGENGSLGG